ncbi:MAG TPA: hypothetical protein VMU59_01680 [Caulobacteraceae bacterium]|nr:hypothetical protein [Caulobacteraceae bacterium]
MPGAPTRVLVEGVRCTAGGLMLALDAAGAGWAQPGPANAPPGPADLFMAHCAPRPDSPAGNAPSRAQMARRSPGRIIQMLT